MDWLTRLPVVGPGFAWLMRTHAWRSYECYAAAKANRLAAAVTYAGFLGIFPVVAGGVAIAAVVLSQEQIRTLERKITDQFPVVSHQLDLSGLVRNAATVGAISGLLLFYAGLTWVDTLRGAIRAIWQAAEPQENVVLKKVKDLGVLAGLGLVLAVSLGTSTLAMTLIGRIADWWGLDHNGFDIGLLRALGILVSVIAYFMLISYLIGWLPGLHPPRRPLLLASVIGAVGFELLTLLLSGYFDQVAAKSMYGAFGTPVALLLWMNLVTRLVLYCASWTASVTPGPAKSPTEGTDGAPDGGGRRGTSPPESGADAAAGKGQANGGGTATPEYLLKKPEHLKKPERAEKPDRVEKPEYPRNVGEVSKPGAGEVWETGDGESAGDRRAGDRGADGAGGSTRPATRSGDGPGAGEAGSGSGVGSPADEQEGDGAGGSRQSAPGSADDPGAAGHSDADDGPRSLADHQEPRRRQRGPDSDEPR